MLCMGVTAYDCNRRRSMTRMDMSKERKGGCTFTFYIESIMGVSTLFTTHDIRTCSYLFAVLGIMIAGEMLRPERSVRKILRVVTWLSTVVHLVAYRAPTGLRVKLQALQVHTLPILRVNSG
jgi:hypothetical protein